MPGKRPRRTVGGLQQPPTVKGDICGTRPKEGEPRPDCWNDCGGRNLLLRVLLSGACPALFYDDMKLIIAVTPYEVRHGSRVDSVACPVALALRRVTGLVWTVGTNLAIPCVEPLVLVSLPPRVAEFVREFDNLGYSGVSPISFTLEVPAELYAASTREALVAT